MGGLFGAAGKGLRGLFGNDLLMNNLSAASAYLDGDYDRAGAIGARSKALRKQWRAKAPGQKESENEGDDKLALLYEDSASTLPPGNFADPEYFPDEPEDEDEPRGWRHGQAPYPGFDSSYQPRFGRPIPVRTFGQHRALPGGTQYFAPDGSLRRKA